MAPFTFQLRRRNLEWEAEARRIANREGHMRPARRGRGSKTVRPNAHSRALPVVRQRGVAEDITLTLESRQTTASSHERWDLLLREL
jgi:hypothetical protein